MVVSNDHANRRAEHLGQGTVTVVPVTSNTTRVLPFQVLLRTEDSGLAIPSKTQVEQVRSVDISRLMARVGRVAPSMVADLDDALRLHLSL